MASKNLSGYPQPIGQKYQTVCVHTGPASYTQVTPGAAPAGGDTFYASEAGLKRVDSLVGSISDNGQYLVVPIFTDNVPSPGTGAQAQVKLMWIVAATGAEVAGGVGLSGRTVRMVAQGN